MTSVPPTPPSAAAPRTAHWVVGLPWLLAGLFGGALAITLLKPAASSLPDEALVSSALAQSTPGVAGARGVFAFTGPLDADRYGLFMIDIEQGTIWVYELEGATGARKMRLAAARTWIYDRYLKDFNSAAPSFREVQELITRERAQVAAPRGGTSTAKPETDPRPAERTNAPLDPTKLPGAGGG